MTDGSVCAVLVTFHPDVDLVRRAVAAVRPQVDALVVVDNASTKLADALTGADAVLLTQQSNGGLAAAQNIGIEWARDHRHSHVLIMDQDSLAGPEMVQALLTGWRALAAKTKVGAVGPRYRDPRDEQDAPFVQVGFPRNHKLWCDETHAHVPCDFLISSGVLIPIAVLDDVGGMDEGLFIDNVDVEWSFRARSQGYELFGVCSARMQHQLGADRQPLLGGRQQVVHGPQRLYFIMRNRVALYRRRHTPRAWIAQDLPRVAMKFLIFSLLVGPRRPNAHHMFRGLVDGVRGRSGRCPL
ncbi:MAG: glycosyltransferase family 2 protein [Actinomycetota bacterium]|nr:glycosyltransferase family 2 protein [Actinomycetota bacterium]